MVDYVSAVGAYKKILDANRKIKPSRDINTAQPNMVLRKGDELLKLNSNIISSASNHVSQSSFEDVLTNEFVKKPISTIKSESKRLFNITQEDALTENQKVLELIKTVDTMDITVKSLVAVRDKIVSSYLDILKMPI
ncbi:MAG: flagellar hook-basal body complex protein FliE [Alphaproteobacteria bacterium]|jgi:flagellar hook-basal body complex protein FliE|nr:flagellar hook-basal body complex protein FliE [Candidatus Jidaibacter sp.]